MNPQYPRKRIRLTADAYRQPGSSWLITIGARERDCRPFADPAVAATVADSIQPSLRHRRLRLDLFCLMPDHLHLVIQNEHDDIVAAMSEMKSLTTRSWWRTGGKGALWQKSFHDHGLRTIRDYEAAIRYVLENPVRAGIVECWDAYSFIGGLAVEEPDEGDL